MSMFYNVPLDSLMALHLDAVRTHSFVEREQRLLSYVQDRTLVDICRTEMDFSIYEEDISERHIRIPRLKELYCRKQESLRLFQQGRDIWKSTRYR